MAIKTCCHCRVERPLERYFRDKRYRDGFHPWCKECRKVLSREAYRNRSPEEIALHRVQTAAYGRRRGNRLQGLKQSFGLTPEQFDTMLKAQGGKCAICGKTDPRGPGNRGRNFHVDHDHATGRLRELLCGACNVGLGHFRDDPLLLLAAVAYLRRHAQIRLAV